MNHRVGVIAEFGAQGFEFVCCFAEVGVGHYDNLYRAGHAILDDLQGWRLRRRISTLPGIKILL
jgi:hypothetical protein